MSNITDLFMGAIFFTAVIGTLCLILGLFINSFIICYIGGLLLGGTFISMFILGAIVESETPSSYYSWSPDYHHCEYTESVQVQASTHKECRACSGTGICQQCRGTGGTGWSGTRVMLKTRCPVCLGSGSCAKCRGTAINGHY